MLCFLICYVFLNLGVLNLNHALCIVKHVICLFNSTQKKKKKKESTKNNPISVWIFREILGMHLQKPENT